MRKEIVSTLFSLIIIVRRNMINNNLVLCIYLVMCFVLYDLHFDIAWPISPHNHYIVEVVMAILCTYMVFAVISFTFTAFQNFQNFKLAGLKDLLLQH